MSSTTVTSFPQNSALFGCGFVVNGKSFKTSQGVIGAFAKAMKMPATRPRKAAKGVPRTIANGTHIRFDDDGREKKKLTAAEKEEKEAARTAAKAEKEEKKLARAAAKAEKEEKEAARTATKAEKEEKKLAQESNKQEVALKKRVEAARAKAVKWNAELGKLEAELRILTLTPEGVSYAAVVADN